jgi:light-regulated signal transduction histidine kinase (bacteriophytochrome)
MCDGVPFRQLMEAVHDALLLADPRGTVVAANSRADRLFGYDAGQLVGLSLDVLLPPDVNAQGDAVGVRRDGTRLVLEQTVSPIDYGGTPHVLRVLRDLRAPKAAAAPERQDEALSRANAELQHFAYLASHDLQEPLRIVNSFAQRLARRAGDRLDADDRESLSFVVDGAARMQKMVEGLLAYSRIGARNTPAETVALDAIVDEVIAGLESDLDDAAVTIARAPLPEVLADRAQMAQLFGHLLGNAVKFRRASAPRVEIRAVGHDRECELIVEDNGIGIDPKHHERIFMMFQRLHTREEYPGTGAGLALCKRIVEGHGGRLWVESSEGAGARFHVTLPLPAVPRS